MQYIIEIGMQGRRKEKVTSTANDGPEVEVIRVIGGPSLGGLGACSPRKILGFKYFKVHS